MTVATPALPLARPAAAPRTLVRSAYRLAARAYVVAIPVQVALAGVFVFVGPQLIEWHKTFAHVFLLLSTTLTLLGLFGRLPAPARRDALVTAGLLLVQGGLVHLVVVSPWIAALHPANALLMFWWAVGTAKRAG